MSFEIKTFISFCLLMKSKWESFYPFAVVPGILLSLHRVSLSTILVKLMPRFSHATHPHVPALRVATLSHMLWNYEACDMWISPNRPTTDEDPGKTQAPSRSSLEKDERLLIGGWLNRLCVELPGYSAEYVLKCNIATQYLLKCYIFKLYTHYIY